MASHEDFGLMSKPILTANQYGPSDFDNQRLLSSPSIAALPDKDSLSLSFYDINYEITPEDAKAAAKTGDGPVSTRILHSVSGHLPAGKLLGIMVLQKLFTQADNVQGASGAGKTSLLDILVSGTILINGKARPKHFNKIAGYVMQDDAHIATLTVRETLWYSLQLRVSQDQLPDKDRHALVESIIAVLNLQKVADSRVGTQLKRGISGGERRRLTIGVELVTSPGILFIDEPTTGLDATNSLRVIQAITQLCRTGRTVVCTIHQPRSNVFMMFDQLLLLSLGRVVYYGDTQAAIPYFSKLGHPVPAFGNPADYFLDMLEGKRTEASTGWGTLIDRPEITALASQSDSDEKVTAQKQAASESVSKLVNAWNEGADKKQLVTKLEGMLPYATAYEPSSRGYGSNMTRIASEEADDVHGLGITQAESTYALSWCKQFQVLAHRLWRGAALGIGFLVGSIFWEQADREDAADGRVKVLLFLMCVFSLFCLPAISKFIEDRVLFQRESASGYYCPSAYFAAVNSVEFPILFVVVVCYGTICYWMTALQPDAGHFAFYLLTILLVINVGFAVAQLVSAAVQAVNMALAAYMIALVWSLLLGGFIVGRREAPEFIRWAFYSSWFNYGFEALCVNEFEAKEYGHHVLDRMDMADADKWIDIYALLGLFVILRSGAFVFLKYAHREQR